MCYTCSHIPTALTIGAVVEVLTEVEHVISGTEDSIQGTAAGTAGLVEIGEG